MLAASAFSSFMEYSGDSVPMYDRRVQHLRASLDVEACVCMTDERSDVEVIHTSTGISATSRKSLAADEADVPSGKPRRCKGKGAKRGSQSEGNGDQGSESGSFRQALGRWMSRRKATSESDDDSSLLCGSPKHSDIFL